MLGNFGGILGVIFGGCFGDVLDCFDYSFAGFFGRMFDDFPSMFLDGIFLDSIIFHTI